MRAYVDRLEGDVASLLLGEDERIPLTVPTQALPAGTREGDVLKLHFEPDPGATRADAAANAALRQRLLDRSRDQPL